MDGPTPFFDHARHIDQGLPNVEAVFHGSYIKNHIVLMSWNPTLIQVQNDLAAPLFNYIIDGQCRTQRLEKRLCIRDRSLFKAVSLADRPTVCPDLKVPLHRSDDVWVAETRYPHTGLYQTLYCVSL